MIHGPAVWPKATAADSVNDKPADQLATSAPSITDGSATNPHRKNAANATPATGSSSGM